MNLWLLISYLVIGSIGGYLGYVVGHHDGTWEAKRRKLHGAANPTSDFN
jgi:hypothetical protein